MLIDKTKKGALGGVRLPKVHGHTVLTLTDAKTDRDGRQLRHRRRLLYKWAQGLHDRDNTRQRKMRNVDNIVKHSELGLARCTPRADRRPAHTNAVVVVLRCAVVDIV